MIKAVSGRLSQGMTYGLPDHGGSFRSCQGTAFSPEITGLPSGPTLNSFHPKSEATQSPIQKLTTEITKSTSHHIGSSSVLRHANPACNRTQWLSIAKFLEKDPLIALGLEGGWARSAAAKPTPGVPDPEFNTPPSNTGVNKVGDVARVERDYRPECTRCVVVVGDNIVVDQCEGCK